MKFLLSLVLLFSLETYAQNGDALVGKWMKTNKEDLIIEVFREGGIYRGKINWSKDRSKPAGYIMLDNLTYNPRDRKWEGGVIHDPKSDRSYDATISMSANGNIEVTGKMMFIRSTRTFKRIS